MKMGGLVSIIVIVWVSVAFSSEFPSADVVMIRGEAMQEQQRLAVGTHIPFGSMVSTRERSMVKLRFPDQSEITLGPSSELRVGEAENKGPTVVALMSGKLRAIVTHHPDDRVKLIVKTRVASLGVRGTDFNVSFNPRNDITTAVAFDGRVDIQKQNPDEATADFSEARTIRHGEFAGVYPAHADVDEPVKISKEQLVALEHNRDVMFETRSSSSDTIVSIDESKNELLVPRPPEENSHYVRDTAIRPGGYIDMETGFYIEPPEGAHFDSKEQVYIVPKEMGAVDAKTGAYIPPKGLILDPIQGFVFLKDSIKGVGLYTWAEINRMKNLMGRMNGELMKGFYYVKDLTGLDASFDGAFVYDSNVAERFYGETTNVTKEGSGVFEMKGFLGRKLFESKQWFVYPYARLDGAVHSRQEDRTINTHDYLTWTLATEVDHKHLLAGRKARFLTGLFYDFQYRDVRNDDLYRFYVHDLGAQVGEEIFWLRGHRTMLAFDLRRFQSKVDDRRGLYGRLQLSQNVLLAAKHELALKASYSERHEEDCAATDIFAASLEYTKRSFLIFRNLHATAGLHYQYTDPGHARDQRGTEIAWGPLLKLEKWLTPNWAWDAFYDYDAQSSKEKTQYNFVKERIGLNLKFVL